MKPRHLVFVAGLMSAALSCSAFGQQDDKLGKVHFPTSCDPKVQAEFERGVAMLHSYWFLYARQTFERVLQQDPNCAMAHWGIAMDLLGNTLVGPPSRADAQAAWGALEKARAIGAKTQREPDDYEARAYYALTLQASAPKSDTTYANQLKSAALLEKLIKPSSMVTSMPRPPNSPRVCTCMSRKLLESM